MKAVSNPSAGEAKAASERYSNSVLARPAAEGPKWRHASASRAESATPRDRAALETFLLRRGDSAQTRKVVCDAAVSSPRDIPPLHAAPWERPFRACSHTLGRHKPTDKLS
ncbi:unnamed protein product, partial [Iphiclides podalirius]